jgi:transcriptional regulator with XRE-family HTH domain
MQRFPEKLRALRERNAMTQRELAEKLGFTHGHIYFLETGKRKPSAEFVVKLAQFFGLATNDLLFDDHEVDNYDLHDNMPLLVLSMERFPGKLLALRKKHGLSQRQLAAGLGYSDVHISYLEAGKKHPSARFVVTLAQFFGLTPNDLLLDEHEVDEKNTIMSERAGLRVREQAEALGYSIKRLAEEAGVDYSVVQSYWHNRPLRVDLEVLTRLAKVLQVRPSALIADPDE